jgi:hypothetical protein
MEGSLTPEESEFVAAHVEACSTCARTVAELGNDTLVDALRAGGATTDTASDVRVKAIIERHQSLFSAEATGDLVKSVEDSDDPSDILSPPQSPDEIGRLGVYRILRTLGQGGMGLVFEAEDIRLERKVALKVMKREIARRTGNHERFLREARTAAKVENDHICPIYQVGEESGVPFIAMPFLKGEPLDTRLRRKSPLPLHESVRIGREIAEGLAAAHAAGLVHRDIKPANVWLKQHPVATQRLTAHFAFGFWTSAWHGPHRRMCN